MKNTKNVMAVRSAPPASAAFTLPGSPKKPEAASQNWWLAGSLLLLAALLAARAFIIRSIPLTGDEAYYWEWSRHLSLGYHDHPPLVAWLIALFSVFGRSGFWVRFPSLVLSTGAGLFLFLFVRDLWDDAKPAFTAVSLFLFIPIFSVVSLAIFPDSPLIFSWSFFLWASWKWLKDERMWPLVGLAAGLAALSKLMGLFLFPSLFLFIAVSKTRASLLRRKSLWGAAALSLAIASPFIYWNFTHHFESFAYQAGHRLAGNLTFSPSLFMNYLSLQIIALSPLVFALIVGTAIMLIAGARRGSERELYLLSMAVPIHAFFAAASFVTRVGLHWALPGYLSILAAAPVWVEKRASAGKKWARPLLALSILSSLAITAFLYSLLCWPLQLVPRIASLDLHYGSVNHGRAINTQTLTEILGYQELGDRVQSDLASLGGEGKSFVFTDSYSLSSVIGFYGSVNPKTLLFNSTGAEYSRWNDFSAAAGETALYVDTQPIGSRPDISRVLNRAFRSIVPLPSLTVRRGNLETSTFYFARCQFLKAPAALELPLRW